ncbi:hypothetical protein BKA93DRAFT_764984 [Sparassis latifolia]
MFICRHLLLRAYVPRRLPAPLVIRRLLSDSFRAPDIPQNAPVAPQTQTQTQTQLADILGPDDVDEETTQLSERSAQGADGREPAAARRPAHLGGGTSTTMQTEATPPDEQDEGWAEDTYHIRSKDEILQDYYASRNTDRSPVASRDLLEFRRLLYVARNRDLRHVTHMLVTDLRGSLLEPRMFAGFVESLLYALVKHQRIVTKRDVLSLFQELEARGGLHLFRARRKLQIIKAIMGMPPEPEFDLPLRDYMVTLLVDMLVNPNEEIPADKRAMSFRALWPLYRFVYGLAKMGERERAHKLIQTLVKTENLSGEAINNTDLESGDFTYIILSATVRSCLLWGWRRRASWLVVNSMPTEEKISPPMAELAIDLLSCLLEPAQACDIDTAASIVMQLMERGTAGCVPHDILQEFYNAAQELERPELVQSVYSLSRNRAIREKYSYPPPGIKLQLWFMQHLATKSMNSHLAREFATQIVEEGIPVHLQDRGAFIALVASQGLATHARTLWDRYSQGEDGEFVVGNATTMVRMVSLFTSLAKRREQLQAKTASLESRSPESDADAAELLHSEALPGADPPRHSNDALSQPPLPRVDIPMASASVTSELTGDTVSEIADAVAALTHASMDGAPGEAAPAETSRLSAGPAQSHDRARDTAPHVTLPREELEPPEEEATTINTESTPEELRAYAERVLSAFRASRLLNAASHQDLNATARACFMLKQMSEGFSAFRMLLNRREVPDVHDVNVVLGVLAEYSPQAGERIIERMLQKGMKPDGVTFGTVIHHAVLHGQMEVVSSLIRRARSLNAEHLTFKTVGTLIRAMVSQQAEEGEVSPIGRLHHAQRLVDMLLQAHQVPSSNMGRDCVVAALRADDPRMAFRFWKLLVKEQVQWDDPMQTATRRVIAARVRRHLNSGWLEPEQGHVMLSELGQEVKRQYRQMSASVALPAQEDSEKPS